ncbi:SPOSA6832_03048, partial [Sporobolomyces salmonicolor]
MPTFVTKNTGGTPHTRLASLISNALASLSPSDPAYAALEEAHALSTGEEPYLEQMTSDLIVPSSHALEEGQVRKVWEELLTTTETTDWRKLKEEGKTTWELGAGMASRFELCEDRDLALALLPTVKSVVALDIEPYLAEFTKPYWDRAGVSSKIDFRIAPALETLKKLREEGCEGFDFVFIDADKPSYEAYVRAVIEEGLLAKDGVILADNTLYKGYPWAPPHNSTDETWSGKTGTNNQSKMEATAGIHSLTVSLCSFNTFVRAHPALECAVLPIRDGITVIRRRV